MKPKKDKRQRKIEPRVSPAGLLVPTREGALTMLDEPDAAERREMEAMSEVDASAYMPLREPL